MLARLDGRLSPDDSVVLLEDVPDADVGNAADDSVDADSMGVRIGFAVFFSTGAAEPKLNPANGEALAGALVEGRVGLKPPEAGVAVSVEEEVAAGNLNPPTAGSAALGASDWNAPNEGLNPLTAVVDDVGDGAGSLKPPALEAGGAGMAKAGLGASGTFLLGGVSIGESFIAVASRFLACTTFPTLSFPAFFMISSRYVLYSALTLSRAAAKLTKGSSRILTDNARTIDSFSPRTDVRYSISFWSSCGCSAFACDVAVDAGLLTVEEDDSMTSDAAVIAEGAPNAKAVLVLDALPNAPVAVGTVVLAIAADDVVAGRSASVEDAGEKANDAKGFELVFGAPALCCSEEVSRAENVELEVGLTGADAVVGAALAPPKLNPEKAPPEVPVLAPVFAGATAPKLKPCVGAADF